MDMTTLDSVVDVHSLWADLYTCSKLAVVLFLDLSCEICDSFFNKLAKLRTKPYNDFESSMNIIYNFTERTKENNVKRYLWMSGHTGRKAQRGAFGCDRP